MIPPVDKPRSPDALWRDEYRRQRAAEWIAAEQPDLFGAEPVRSFRRNAKPKPIVDRKRYNRRRDFLTPAEQAAMLATAANWLRVRQRVRIDAEAPHEFAGREGVVWRLCSPVFADRVYVYLDPVGNEHSEKIAFAEVRDVEPIGE